MENVHHEVEMILSVNWVLISNSINKTSRDSGHMLATESITTQQVQSADVSTRLWM